MSLYIFFLVVLFILAISDLMVGVANDAVNFLNSAIGAKVASRKVIMIVASAGILTGVLFANGMMEVARKGLFQPQYYLFSEVIIIFLAVMFTDILLLDFFNTFGLPTSTTVSLVFGLLGAAVGMAIYKVGDGAIVVIDGVQKVAEISDFINSSKALTIISSILLSVILSFIFGAIVQWISRFVFTFNIEKTIKYYGSVWGGLAISAITYFMLIKGVKDASFMSAEKYAQIKENTGQLIFLSFILWTIILQLMSWIFKTNPLKIVVLTGTFALAMAFAGNDLVNFVGVPLAGLESYKIFAANGGKDLLMGNLLGDINTPSIYLISAGVIMLAVLWFSKKAKSVIETSLNLSRQGEGTERFRSTVFSRVLVRHVVGVGNFLEQAIPNTVIHLISKRFEPQNVDEQSIKNTNPPMFDLLRASVNMMVAAILIAVGTSFKLPLSTTYVTFMVAMSTSLVDGAWGRDSAVYRVSGVFTVIGGWLITGLAAFILAFIICLFMGWAQVFGVIIVLTLVIISFYRTRLIHKKREEDLLDKSGENELIPNAAQMLENNNKEITKNLNLVGVIFSEVIQALILEDRLILKNQLQRSEEMEEKLINKKNKIYQTINSMHSASIEASYFYILTLDYLMELAHSTRDLVEPVFNHVDNIHKPIKPLRAEELSKIALEISGFTKMLTDCLGTINAQRSAEINAEQARIIGLIRDVRTNLIKAIKKKEVSTKNSILLLNILSESHNILNYSVTLIKIQSDFEHAMKA